MTLTWRLAEKNDEAALINLWRDSVRATHDFLSETDQTTIEKNLPHYFEHVQLKVWQEDSQLIGFSGTAEHSLEMLFLSPEYFGRGYGNQILQQLMEDDGITKIDVNEDNPRALRFYQKNGFEVASRSPLDDDGRPYPILHLEKA